MGEREIEPKKIKAGWYYFLNFYFWVSIILIIFLVVVGTFLYFRYISPNLDTWAHNYELVVRAIEEAKPVIEDYLNLTHI